MCLSARLKRIAWKIKYWVFMMFSKCFQLLQCLRTLNRSCGANRKQWDFFTGPFQGLEKTGEKTSRMEEMSVILFFISHCGD